MAKRRADKAPIDKGRAQLHEHCESNVVDGPKSDHNDAIRVSRSDAPCSDLPIDILSCPEDTTPRGQGKCESTEVDTSSRYYTDWCRCLTLPAF